MRHRRGFWRFLSGHLKTDLLETLDQSARTAIGAYTDAIRIEPEHHGQGYGLYAARQLHMSCLEMLRHSESARTILTAAGKDAFRAGPLPKPSYATIGH